MVDVTWTFLLESNLLDSSIYILMLHAMKLIDAPLEHYSLDFRVS